MSEPSPPQKPARLRLRALAVAVPVVVLIGGALLLLLDGAVEGAVEDTGADIVGARVDVDRADVRLAEGRILLERVQVANPDAPFTNLIEVAEVAVDLRVEPLLAKKVVISSADVRGVRFGTPRETSGELENPSPESGRLWREVNEWADRVVLPALRLDGLGDVVAVDAISDDSLSTLARSRALVEQGDSLLVRWRRDIGNLDPRPLLDSAQALAEQLGQLPRTPQGALQGVRLVRIGRDLMTRLSSMASDIQAFDSLLATDVDGLRTSVQGLAPAMEADLAYARRLLRLPSLEQPDFSPVVFRETAISWLKPVLYWAHTAERVLPPGLDPRRRPGPTRPRASGTTVTFPGGATYPSFLLEQGALDLEIGGAGLGAGRYQAQVRGLTSEPGLSGQPMVFEVFRGDAARGPGSIAVRASLHHASRPLRDSVQVRLSQVDLPAIDIPRVGARLVPGSGELDFELARVAGEIDARFRWASDAVEWEGGPTTQGSAAPVGSRAWVTEFLWRSLAGVRRLDLEMGFRGSLSDPEVWIRSNAGSAIAESLRAQVSAEVQEAEARLRSEVDRRISPVLADARRRVAELEEEATDQLGPLLREVEAARARLEAAVRTVASRDQPSDQGAYPMTLGATSSTPKGSAPTR